MPDIPDQFESYEDDPNSAWDYPKTQLKFVQAPKIVGHYVLGQEVYGGGSYTSLALAFIRKPNWLHRLCMRVFLGFEWRDAP